MDMCVFGIFRLVACTPLHVHVQCMYMYMCNCVLQYYNVHVLYYFLLEFDTIKDY